MARFVVYGMEQVVQEMEAREENLDAVVLEMLYAGADEIVMGWREAIAFAGLIDSHDMIDSVGYNSKATKTADERAVTVHAIGKDRKGTRNDEKAFIGHYGREKQNATRFVDKAEAIGAPTANMVMAQIWTDYIVDGELSGKIAPKVKTDNSRGRSTNQSKKKATISRYQPYAWEK